jgi:hypothetical protein
VFEVITSIVGPSRIALEASVKPAFCASWRAVLPAIFLKSASAPSFKKAVTAPAWPWKQAYMTGIETLKNLLFNVLTDFYFII